MPQNIFKIYDGRTSFWQWDTEQKLIVLDDNVTEVCFAHKDMTHAICRQVYELDGLKVCSIPDILLQIPKNLIAYAYADGATIKSVKFAVNKRAIPSGYVSEQLDGLDEVLLRLDVLEDKVANIGQGGGGGQYDDTVIVARIKAAEDAIRILNSSNLVDGSVDKKVTSAINEFSAKISSDGVVNTYKELIDYAAAHGAEFTTLVGKVDVNTKSIAALNGDASTLKADVSDAVERVAALETSYSEFTEATVQDINALFI